MKRNKNNHVTCVIIISLLFACIGGILGFNSYTAPILPELRIVTVDCNGITKINKQLSYISHDKNEFLYKVESSDHSIIFEFPMNQCTLLIEN